MSENLFEVKDKSGRLIRLTDIQWSHISVRHPIVEKEKIQETIKNPNVVNEKDGLMLFHNYYKHRKDSEKYLRVIIKYLNGDGYVITAYYMRKK